MDSLWANLLIEIALFTLLGVLYYFYQKRKLHQYEENKAPLVMGFVLQACLVERGDDPDPKLDALIEALDDYIQNKTSTPPLAMLRIYAASPECSAELRDVISEGLLELEPGNEKK